MQAVDNKHRIRKAIPRVLSPIKVCRITPSSSLNELGISAMATNVSATSKMQLRSILKRSSSKKELPKHKVRFKFITSEYYFISDKAKSSCCNIF